MDTENTKTSYGSFVVDEFITFDEAQKMVGFDSKDLNTAFAKNPTVIAYFGAIFGRAKRQVADFKTRRDAVMSLVSRKLRDASTQDGGKAWAENRIESEMRSDQNFINVSKAYNHALEVEQSMEALYWAARGRRNDMEFFARREEHEMSKRGSSASYSPS